MRILKLTSETKSSLLKDLLKRSPGNYTEFEGRVNDIVNKVREQGDEALFEYTKAFDKADINISNVKVTEQEIEEAYGLVDKKLLEVIRKAKENIWDYHIKQRQYSWFDSKENGTILGQKVTPLKDVGVYVPG